MLYDNARHLPVSKTPWSADAAEAALIRVLTTAIANYSDQTLWQTPAELESDSAVRATIYKGAMGVLWALDYLDAYLPDELPFDKHELAGSFHRRFLESDVKELSEYSIDGKSCPSYWLGESGLLLVMSKLQPSSAQNHWQSLLPIIRGNMKNPTMEPLWGGTGSIIPALFKLEQEDSPQWREVLSEHAQFMKNAITRDNPQNCPIWIQDLYGQKRTLIGAGHGFVGNMYPFLRGAHFLPKHLADWALNDSVECIIKAAKVENDCCNWAPNLVPPEDGKIKMLLQWCHGAPGVIISLNAIPAGYSQEFDALMIKAGETIWQAGPLTKGVGICHGTDGNGFALLKIYSRTKNPIWLERARSFAMAAIDQNINGHSLWEGDLGLACYLHACVVADDRFPLLDIC